VQPLQAPAGAGKTHSLKALRVAAHRARKQVLVLAPTGKAVDEAMAEGAGDRGLTVAKALSLIADRHTSTTGARAITAEGQPKPVLKFNTDKVIATAQKIAAHTGISWESLSDWGDFASYVQTEIVRRW
jgi:AAA domain-containing protein